MSRVPAVHVIGRGIVARRMHAILRDRSPIGHDPRSATIEDAAPRDVVVMAQGGFHSPMLSGSISRGAHVVTVGDSLDDTQELLGFDQDALDAGTSLVVGAAMCPGLSGLIARHLADQLVEVDEIHIAVHGTAGPSCAASHHRSLSGRAIGWHDGAWTDHVGGSGRELCWFPEPVGAKDCYRAQSAEPLLLHRAFPDVERTSVRRSATRRDRLTARLPMLRPPHPEGGVGAVRVEVRGTDEHGGRQCSVAGVAELVGSVAAATAAAFVAALLDDSLPGGVVVAGDAGLPTLDLLEKIGSFGVRLQEFTGVPQSGDRPGSPRVGG